MDKLEDLGYEIKEIPIKKVRVRKHGSKWVVEYKLKNPKFLYDRWWWFDDSLHSNFSDASVRCYTLNAVGKFSILKKINTIVMTVKGTETSSFFKSINYVWNKIKDNKP